MGNRSIERLVLKFLNKWIWIWLNPTRSSSK